MTISANVVVAEYLLIDAVEDPPYDDQTPMPYRVKPSGAVGSTSDTPFFGNSFDAADEVIRAGYARRNAQTRVAQMFSTTSHALLSSSEG